MQCAHSQVGPGQRHDSDGGGWGQPGLTGSGSGTGPGHSLEGGGSEARQQRVRQGARLRLRARSRARVVGAAEKVKGAIRGRTLLGSRLWWLRWGKGRRNEVKVDGPSPSPFIKPVGSRKASEHFSYNSEICFQPTVKNAKKKQKFKLGKL